MDNIIPKIIGYFLIAIALSCLSYEFYVLLSENVDVIGNSTFSYRWQTKEGYKEVSGLLALAGAYLIKDNKK